MRSWYRLYTDIPWFSTERSRGSVFGLFSSYYNPPLLKVAEKWRFIRKFCFTYVLRNGKFMVLFGACVSHDGNF